MSIFRNMTKARKLSKAKELFIRAVDADNKWQSEARADFNFRDGDQWTSEEKKILEDELRPILTFNLTKSSVDLIMGMNEDNRIKHRASPMKMIGGWMTFQIFINNGFNPRPSVTVSVLTLNGSLSIVNIIIIVT